MKRHLSEPTLELLKSAKLQPEEVDVALEHLVSDNRPAVLRANHPIVQRIQKASGLCVVQVARRSRYLLIEIEQPAHAGAVWQYRERTPRDCLFSCRGEIAETVRQSLIGRQLEQLVAPTPAIARCRIEGVDDTRDGWLIVAVRPMWYSF